MAVFERDIFIDNIYYLAKANYIKISDLETFAGVSKGYLSRLRKDPKKTTPSIVFISSVANRLQVSIDTLISHPLNSKTSTELLIIKFIDALIRQTNEEDLIWNSESVKELSKTFYDMDNVPSCHPISHLETSKGGYKAFYESPYHLGIRVRPSDMFFSTKINKGTVYLIKYHVPTEDGSFLHSEPLIEYDLLIVNRSTTEKIAHYNHYQPTDIFSVKLEELYTSIYDSSSRTHLSKDTKEIINEFLDIDDLPF